MGFVKNTFLGGAEEKAAATQATAATRAGEVGSAAQEEAAGLFAERLGGVQAQFQPFIAGGTEAFQKQQALSGAAGPEAQAQAFQQFQESPGVQFLREQGLRGTESGLAATGTGGGTRLKALSEFNQGLALQDLSRQTGQLQSLSQQGLSAAGTSGGLTSQFTAGQAGAITGAGAETAGGILGAGQAEAAGRLGKTAAIRGTIGGLTGGALGTPGGSGGGTAGGGIDPASAVSLATALSDKNMKTDITDLNLKECFDNVIEMPLKSWRYLESAGIDTELHMGPMVQDAPEMIKVPGELALSIHDELMMIAGAIQHMKNEGMLNGRIKH